MYIGSGRSERTRTICGRSGHHTFKSNKLVDDWRSMVRSVATHELNVKIFCIRQTKMTSKKNHEKKRDIKRAHVYVCELASTNSLDFDKIEALFLHKNLRTPLNHFPLRRGI